VPRDLELCPQINGYPGLTVEHSYVQFGDPSCIGFKTYRVGQKSDTARTYITLYERYHFFGPPGSVKKQTEVSEKPILATDAGVGKNVAV